MGEIADMMLDGTMCQLCGEWLHEGEDGPGYPGYCASCQPDDRPEYRTPTHYRHVSCPTCHRRFREKSHMKQHRRDKHGWE